MRRDRRTDNIDQICLVRVFQQALHSFTIAGRGIRIPQILRIIRNRKSVGIRFNRVIRAKIK